jgi:hypothetical protein
LIKEILGAGQNLFLHMVDLPIDFEKLVREPKGQTASDYPYALKAEDLMRNFVFAALEVEPTLLEDVSGKGGHRARKLAIPAVPSEGTFVLGAVDGVVQWIETEACD